LAKAPKPDLDDATIQIARRMLSMPPKPHDEMKKGKSKVKPKKYPPKRIVKKVGKLSP
jgi:hypothetical protein